MGAIALDIQTTNNLFFGLPPIGGLEVKKTLPFTLYKNQFFYQMFGVANTKLGFCRAWFTPWLWEKRQLLIGSTPAQLQAQKGDVGQAMEPSGRQPPIGPC